MDEQGIVHHAPQWRGNRKLTTARANLPSVKQRPTRRRRLALAMAVVSAITAVSLGAVTVPAIADAASDWTELKERLHTLSPTWSDPALRGAITTGMPSTALLGNGDTGVTSNGVSGRKDFIISKGDFWNGNRGTSIVGLGGVTIGDSNSAGESGFSETQNIAEGRIDTNGLLSGTKVTMQTWVAASSNQVVSKITSDSSTDASITLQTWVGAGRARGDFSSTAGVTDGTLWATRATAPGSNWVSRAALATRVVGATLSATTSNASSAQGTFTLPAHGTVYVVTGVGGGGQDPALDTVKSAATTLVNNKTAADIDALDTARAAWWQDYWSKSSVTLNDPLLEKYYYNAQYFIGASSRPGKVAPGLYGIWITTDAPGWHGDMHLNYNFAANFYGTYSSNRLEQALPAFDIVSAYLPEAQRRSKAELRRVNNDYVLKQRTDLADGIADGVLFPVGIGPWGSTTDDVYLGQTINSLYLASQYVEYWNYSADPVFLKNTAYPYLTKVAAFFTSWMQYNATTQKYELYSGPHEGTWARNPSGDVALLRSVLEVLTNTGTAMGESPATVAGWHDVLGKLAEPATGTYNSKTVYLLADSGTVSDRREIRPGDNTVNLEFIHPGDYLNIRSSAASKQIAWDTIDVMNSWAQNNSFSKVYTAAARTGYNPTTILTKLRDLLTTSLDSNARVDDGIHGLEKVGATEAINSMLLQSDGDVITVFPNWPSDKDAAFKTLRAEGGFLVSASKSGSTISSVEIQSTVGGTVNLALPWTDGVVTVTKGNGSAVVAMTSDSVLSFATDAGQTYTVSHSTATPTPTAVALTPAPSPMPVPTPMFAQLLPPVPSPVPAPSPAPTPTSTPVLDPELMVVPSPGSVATPTPDPAPTLSGTGIGVSPPPAPSSVTAPPGNPADPAGSPNAPLAHTGYDGTGATVIALLLLLLGTGVFVLVRRRAIGDTDTSNQP